MRLYTMLNPVILNEFLFFKGINKHLDKEGSNTKSGHQRLNPRKNPREELSILDEQDLHLKKQRTTGAFGEASLVRYFFYQYFS